MYVGVLTYIYMNREIIRLAKTLTKESIVINLAIYVEHIGLLVGGAEGLPGFIILIGVLARDILRPKKIKNSNDRRVNTADAM